jgi:hypothetical protein
VHVVTHELPQDLGGDPVPFAGAGIDVPGAIPLVARELLPSRHLRRMSRLRTSCM